MKDMEIEVKFIPHFKREIEKKLFTEYVCMNMKPRAQWYITGKHPMRISYRNGSHKFTVKFGSQKDYARVEIEKPIDTEVAKILVENYCTVWVFKNHMEWKMENGQVMEINLFLKSQGLSNGAIIIEVEYDHMVTVSEIEETKKQITKELNNWIDDVEIVDPFDHSLDNYSISVSMKKEDKFIADDTDAEELKNFILNGGN